MWSEGGALHPFLDPRQSHYGQDAEAARQAANAASVMGAEQVSQRLHDAARHGYQAQIQQAAAAEAEAMWWINHQARLSFGAARSSPAAPAATVAPVIGARNPILRAAEEVERRVEAARGRAQCELLKPQPRISPGPRSSKPAGIGQPRHVRAERSNTVPATAGVRGRASSRMTSALVVLAGLIALLGMLPAFGAVMACLVSPRTAIPDAWPWLTLYVGSWIVIKLKAD